MHDISHKNIYTIYLVLFSNHLAGGMICFKKSQKNINLSEWKLSMFGYICVAH